uniref:THAP-type domain-containing protein n=1 Tax=Plectus sambesii TaxID=2011161 RepID=A0A914VXQ8_9BILA
MPVDKAANSKESTADNALRSAVDSADKDMTPTADDDSNQGTDKSDGARGQKARKSISVAERTSSRRTARYTCCVPKCSSDEKSVKPNGRPVLFFDMPEASDRRLRRLWVQAVPELQFAVTPSQKKVCERHFVDGRPTDDHPCPDMCLGDEVADPKPKKRKSEPAPAVTPNGNGSATNSAKKTRLSSGSTPQSPSPQSLDQVLQKVAKVATESPKTRASAASEGNVSSSPSQKPTEADQQQSAGVSATKVVNQNQPRILRLPIKAFKTISGSGGGALPKGIQILTHKAGSSPSHFQLPKGIVARPVAAPTVGILPTVVKEKKEGVAENNIPDNTPTPANGTEHNNSPGVAISTGSSKTAKKTLQSVLDGLKQQQLSALEEDPPTFTQPAPPPPAVKNMTSEDLLMCGRCAADLPILRRSLGRLESRLDSMISMVRTLCQRQSSTSFDLKQRDNVRSSMTENAAAQNSMMQPSVAKKTLTPTITRRPVVDVKIAKNNGADGSSTSSSMSTHTATNSTGNTAVKRVIRIPVSLAKGHVNVGIESAKKLREEADPDNSSSSDADDRLQIDETPGKANNASDDTKPYLTKAIARSLLLFPADAFTISEYRDRGPVYARAASEEKLQEILRQLIDDRLLRRIDDHLPLADINAAYEKERSPSRLEAIAKYGIALPTYINSFETRRS